MKSHCLQHVSFEDMGAIETWLLKSGFEITVTRFFEAAILPAVADVDWIIIMGGPMSVLDEKKFPWLIAEKEFIRNCIAANKVVIGICLGAQLISNSLGGSIFKNKEKEIGWFPIWRNKNATSVLFLDFPDEITVFHWHGETFDLPDGAELVASSEVCKNQVFCVGDKVIGFQCHLETTSQTMHSLILNSKDELVPANFIQLESELEKKEKIYEMEMHKVLFEIFDRLLH